MDETTFKFTTIERASREYLDSLLDGQEQPFFTGLPSIDRSMGGLHKGELCIVGGRPSHGKSMFGLNWLYNVAAEQVNCLMISEEMSKSALAMRSLSFITDMPQDRWRDSYDAIYEQSAQFWRTRGNVLIVESVWSVTRATEAIEHAVKYSAVEFVVVDYLQLLTGRGGNKYEQVSNVSSELKHAAVKHNVAVVVLAQLGREIDKRGDNIPRLFDLKDSGQIEQDADQVMFVQWPLKNDPKYRPINEYRVFCAKNRNRAINQTVVELRFVPSRQKLQEIPVEAMPNYTPQFDTFSNR